jgi:pseudouridine-5'-monophosphatase
LIELQFQYLKMSRWSRDEIALLAEMRNRLRKEISEAGQFPEVVGDRPLIRFLRGHGHNIDKATAIYASFLQWRQQYGVDAVREDICRNHKQAMDFPFSKNFITDIWPQITMSTGMRDTAGNPIAIETYNYSPRAVFQHATPDDYTRFMIYCMEFKIIILEQLSEEAERKFLRNCNFHPPQTQQGYGVILQCTILRDIKDISREFLSSEAKNIFRISIGIAQNNYPEMLYKCHMLNAGWMFSTVWYFAKGLMDARTVAKVTSHGNDFLVTLGNEITASNMPTFLGGKFQCELEPPFIADLEEFGLLHLWGYSSAPCYLEHMRLSNNIPCSPSNHVSSITSTGPAISTAHLSTGRLSEERLSRRHSGSGGNAVIVTGILASAAHGSFERTRKGSFVLDDVTDLLESETKSPSAMETSIPTSEGNLTSTSCDIKTSDYGEGNKIHPILGCIFDLDGTLLDSESVSTLAVQCVLDRYVVNGIVPQFTSDIKRQTMGLKDTEWTQLVVEKVQLNGNLTAEELLAAWEVSMETLMGEIRVLPGGHQLIDRLTAFGMPLAIATSSSTKIVTLKRNIVPDIFNRMSAVICGDEVIHGKPSPDIFLLAAEKLHILPANCLVIEDSLAGIKAAKAAGMRVCACVPDIEEGYLNEIRTILETDDCLIHSLLQFDYTKWSFASSTASNCDH